MTHVYYKYAIAAIIVFDLGRPATFESVVKVGVSPTLTNFTRSTSLISAISGSTLIISWPAVDCDKARLERGQRTM
jgi:hypothetical protein